MSWHRIWKNIICLKFIRINANAFPLPMMNIINSDTIQEVTMKRCVILEPEAEQVCNASAIPPKIYQLPPQEGREVLEKAQDTPVFMYPAKIDSMKIDTGNWGEIPLYMVSPREMIELSLIHI